MGRSLVIAVALAAVVACEEAGEIHNPGCFSIQDCGRGQTCFYGRCVDTGFGVTSVYAELKPPSDTPWLEQQVHCPLSLGYQDITLRASVSLRGSIRPSGMDDGSLDGAVVARATWQVIPGRDIIRQAAVGDSGFDLQVLPVEVELAFEPGDENRPPKNYWLDMRDTEPYGRDDLVLPYPTDAELATVRGRVLQTDDILDILDGARVVGTAQDPQHTESPFRSTIAATDASGEFAITFLPEATLLDVRVGPNPGVNELVPEITFEGLTPVEGGLGDLVLDIDEEQPEVTAVVRDESGTAVADANVVFEGSVGARAGRFVVSESSNAAGSVATTLLAGEYRVTVAPQTSQPYALVTEATTIPNGNYLEITVAQKVTLSGCVSAYQSSARVPDADVTLTRLDSPVPRVFRTTTDAAGCYEVDVDPGAVDASETFQPAEYELTIQPKANAGLPFYRELLQIADSDEPDHDIELYASKLVHGMVWDPNGMPLANVIIGFFSLELGDPDEAVLVGVVSTRDGLQAGEFVLPVPVVPES